MLSGAADTREMSTQTDPENGPSGRVGLKPDAVIAGNGRNGRFDVREDDSDSDHEVKGYLVGFDLCH